jgi:hypothetical protein
MISLRPLAVIFALFFAPFTADAVEPWAVLTGQSVLQVRAGLRHLYKRLDRKELVVALDSAGATNLLTGNLKGLDLNRPLGAFVMPNAVGVGSILTFIPITNEEEFRGFLERHGIKPGIEERGITTVEVPFLGPVWMKFDKKHAWFALTAEDLTRPLPDPMQSIPEVHRKTTLAASLYIERMPPDQREVWAKRGEQALGFLLKSDPKSSAQLGEAIALPAAGGFLRLVAKDARSVTLLAQADVKDDQFWAEAIVEPRPGTSWAEQAAGLEDDPFKLEVDARQWAKLRGIPDEKARLAAQAAFTTPGLETIHITTEGGDVLRFKARMSGAVLAYHAALEKDKPPKVKRERKERERRKDRR